MIRYFSIKNLIYIASLLAGVVAFGSIYFRILNNPLEAEGSEFERAYSLFLFVVNSAGYSVVIMAAIIFLLSITPIWNAIWKISTFLGLGYPYINGTYDVYLSSSWPLIKANLAGDSNGNEELTISAPVKNNSYLIIDIGLFGSRIEMIRINDEDAVIDRSRIVAYDLLWPCDGLPYRLSYVYNQDNTISRIEDTDVDSFYGAALIKILSSEELRGLYWTNRNWRKGLNSAGEIVLKRQGK